MSTHGVVEPINVFANGFDRIIACLENSSPDQLRLDRLEDGFHHRIIVTVSFSAYGWKHFVSFEDFAIQLAYWVDSRSFATGPGGIRFEH